MKKLSIFLLTALPFLTVFSQVGINTLAPQSTLHIAAQNSANPTTTDGIIIPRVTSLNTEASKPNSLLVFLESSDAGQRGFYYWRNNSWIPFVTTNKLQENRSVLVFRGASTLTGGNYTLETTGTNTRTYGFQTDNHLSTNGNFAYVNNGKIVIQKAGKYDITAVVTLQVNAQGRSRRDSYEVSIRKNNSITNLKSAYGFPNAGTTYTFTTSIPITGALEFAIGDVIDIHINRFHTPSNISGDSGSQITSIIPELSNLALRYMGT